MGLCRVCGKEKIWDLSACGVVSGSRPDGKTHAGDFALCADPAGLLALETMGLERRCHKYSTDRP